MVATLQKNLNYQFQSEKWMKDDIVVTNALSSVCYVAGDKRLFWKNLSPTFPSVKRMEGLLALKVDNLADIGANCTNIAVTYNLLGNTDKAFEYFKKALDIQRQVLDANHPDLAATINNMGNLYYNIGNLEMALQHFQEAVEIKIKTFGKNHRSFAGSYGNIAMLLDQLKEHDEAITYYKKALEILLQLETTQASQIEGTLSNLLKCAPLASPAQIKTLEKTYTLSTKVLGKEHPLNQKFVQIF